MLSRSLATALFSLILFAIFGVVRPSSVAIADDAKPAAKKEPWKSEDFIYSEGVGQYRFLPTANGWRGRNPPATRTRTAASPIYISRASLATRTRSRSRVAPTTTCSRSGLPTAKRSHSSARAPAPKPSPTRRRDAALADQRAWRRSVASHRSRSFAEAGGMARQRHDRLQRARRSRALRNGDEEKERRLRRHRRRRSRAARAPI